MAAFTEQTEIPASYEKMEAWITNFEEELVRWSLYHIEYDLYNGNYHAGSKIRFRTYQALDTIKIETSDQTVQEITDELCVL